MSELLKINVNDKTERKNGLSYLSWAWAWAEVLKIDPDATWELVEYPQPDGTLAPCMFLPDATALVKTVVTIKGQAKKCLLPVMDHRNKAIPKPNAFQINTAVMRCMTKAISMHGLGLYIYAGEDLPEGEERPDPRDLTKGGTVQHSPTQGAMEEIEDDERRLHIQLVASIVANKVAAGEVAYAYKKMEAEKFDDAEKTGLWSLLDSKTRSAIKKHIASLVQPVAA
jgi:hypothetical protein